MQRQIELFTRAQLAGMRDRTRRRNYSAEAEEFRREHQRHREWGLRQRHARKLSRLYGSPAAAWAQFQRDADELRSPSTPARSTTPAESLASDRLAPPATPPEQATPEQATPEVRLSGPVGSEPRAPKRVHDAAGGGDTSLSPNASPGPSHGRIRSGRPGRHHPRPQRQHRGPATTAIHRSGRPGSGPRIRPEAGTELPENRARGHPAAPCEKRKGRTPPAVKTVFGISRPDRVTGAERMP